MGLGTIAEELPCWLPIKFVLRCSLPPRLRRREEFPDKHCNASWIKLYESHLLYNVPGKNVGGYCSFMGNLNTSKILEEVFKTLPYG